MAAFRTPRLNDYREDGRLEVHAVVQARDGRLAAIEVKLGSEGGRRGGPQSLRLAERVDPKVVGPPQGVQLFRLAIRS